MPTATLTHPPVPRLRTAPVPVGRPWLRRVGLPVAWLGLVVAIAVLDFATGPYLQFPALFMLPVGLAAWHSGRTWGWAAGILASLLHLYEVQHAQVPGSTFDHAVNAAVRMAVFLAFAWLVARVRDRQRILAENRVLRGLLPVCAHCKAIRDEAGRWQPIERYLSDRTEASFSHGFCPDCALQHYGIGPDEIA